MKQTMGQILRQLRKEKNLTQDELAEQLNLSSAAISKWENDTSMPDISQVVPICNVFGIQADVLFGRFGINDVEEVEKIINESNNIFRKSREDDSSYNGFLNAVVKAYEYIKPKIGNYPNNFKLLTSFAGWAYDIIWGRNEKYIKDRFSENEIADIKNESVRSCRFVMANSKDTTEKINAASQLIAIYNSYGEFDKSEELLEYMPKDFGSWRGFWISEIKNRQNDTAGEIKQLSVNASTLITWLFSEVYALGTAYAEN
ncbi:MAG: helix-turn-helix domain-containing protein [Eubacteriales bacterium]